jgi:hypothetical protein
VTDPPTHCRKGHPLGPRLVHLSWQYCACPGATHGGHRTYHCEHVIDGVRCGDEQVPGHVGSEPPPAQTMPSLGG